jgi:pSer/pThr/pTyr-binding forkhead associated (FHA) protein
LLDKVKYWISTKSGPYTPQQLRLLWDQGTLNDDTSYFDDATSEWLPVRRLVEGNQMLFSSEEAFVRLGESRLKGCLCIYNKDERIDIFVDEGFVLSAVGDNLDGEFALSKALHLEESTYEWFANTEPPTAELRLNIAAYALQNSVARDVRIASAPRHKLSTKTTSITLRDKVSFKSNYVLVSVEGPTLKIKLTKMTNIVGRGPECDIVIDNPNVSKKHCLLEIGDQNVKVKDLDSTNGTKVNGTSVKDGVLKTGGQLGLGNFQLILNEEAKKAPTVVV